MLEAMRAEVKVEVENFILTRMNWYDDIQTMVRIPVEE
jgi:hypothetical protein